MSGFIRRRVVFAFDAVPHMNSHKPVVLPVGTVLDLIDVLDGFGVVYIRTEGQNLFALKKDIDELTEPAESDELPVN